MLEQVRYHKRYNQRVREQGVDLSMSCATNLFDGDKMVIKMAKGGGVGTK